MKGKYLMTATEYSPGTNIILPEKSDFVKWELKKGKNLKIADKMIDAGFTKRGYFMRTCATFLQYKKCPDCGKSFISSANLCRDRLCPTCSWRLSLQRFAEMCQTFSLIGEIDNFSVGFLTLTVKNCKPENLSYTIKKMNEDWDRLLKRRPIKRMTAGWAKSLEITYNKKARTFHPHFHIIWIFNEERTATEGELNYTFRQCWNEVCRLDYDPITDYREISAKTDYPTLDNDALVKSILETFKYSVKDSELEDMPTSVFRSFVNGIKNIRFVSYGGIIKICRAQLNLLDSDTNTEDDINLQRDLCTCGAELTKMVLQWCFSENQYKRINI